MTEQKILSFGEQFGLEITAARHVTTTPRAGDSAVCYPRNLQPEKKDKVQTAPPPADGLIDFDYLID